MPLHDWTKVEGWVFAAFHNHWIIHIAEALNDGVLPDTYSAEAELITSKAKKNDRLRPDVVTLRPQPTLFDPSAGPPGIAVADAPPNAQRMELAFAPVARRHVVIRHTSGDQVVAIIELVSPANKDRPSHVDQFIRKVESALSSDIHVVVLDILPPGRHDPGSFHSVITSQFGPHRFELPSPDVRTFASYVAEVFHAYVNHPTVGRSLPNVPLFLTPERYVDMPLEPSYQETFRRSSPRLRNAVPPLPPDRPQE